MWDIISTLIMVVIVAIPVIGSIEYTTSRREYKPIKKRKK